MSKESLVTRIHASPLLWDLCKVIGYVGFPFRELASWMKPLVDQHGARKVSLALAEVAIHVGWRTMLNPQARKACFAVLGPAPEQWDWYYTNGLGEPTPRPPEHQTPPVISEREIDPILDSLTRLTATELDMKLQLSRAILQRNAPDHEQQVARNTIPRIESEMIRRGQDIPPEEKAEAQPAEEKSVKRKRKKVT